MAISFTNKPAGAPAFALPPKKRARVKAQAPMIDLNQPGRLRVTNLMALYGFRSANTLYTHLHFGKIPPPDGRDGDPVKGRPWWHCDTIRKHLKGDQQ